jgi:hypothetical protein
MGTAPGLVWILKHWVEKLLLRLFPPDDFDALLVSKRLEVKTKDKEVKTFYYLTFQYGLNVRTEHKVKTDVYALHAEGDTGILSMRSEKFVSFKRFL